MSKVTSANKPLHKLLEGIRTTSSTRTLRKTLADEIDLAKARLKAYASEDTKAAKAARGSMDATLKAIKQGVGDLDGYWNAAVARYRDVVYGNMRTSGLVGINQNAIPSDGTSLRFRVFATDGRTYILHPSFDSRQITAEMSTPYYAEGLALAEYVYMNGYVTSLEIYAGELENLMIREAGQAASFRTGATKDMHETGSAMTVLLTNMYYRGLAAGLLEFAEKLKTKTVEGRSVWAETVVQFTSEFNRAARSDASGSDHGFNQMVTSAFSGAFTNGPEVVGNIKRTGLNDSTYAGTQGIAAAIPGYTHSGAPSPIMVASTMTSLIGGGYNPWLNLAAPLVTLTNGVLTPTFGRGKITEE